jgi:hypothetical protein
MAACIVLGALMWTRRLHSFAPLLLAALVGCFLGCARCAPLDTRVADLTPDARAVHINGTVRESRGLSWVIDITGERSILLNGVRSTHLQPGDEISADVTVATPGSAPGADSAVALDRIGVDGVATARDIEVIRHTWTLSRVLSNERTAVAGAINRVMPPQSAALTAGIVFGVHETLAPDVVATLQQSGLYHIVAVSGLKVVIALALLRWLAQALEWSRRRHLAIMTTFAVF